MKITMKDIAKEAGVSIATVSHIINGTKNISKEKHDRVMNIIKKYNYIPNSMAKSLRNHTTKTAAVVVSSFPDSHVTNIVNGIGKRAREFGYNLLFVNTNENFDYEKETIDLLYSKMVDGLILSPTPNKLPYLTRLVEKGFPIVFVNRYDQMFDTVPRISADDFQAGFDATNHLIKHGHKEIGCISGHRYNISTTENRIKGYISAHNEAGLMYKEDNIISTDTATVEGGRIATRKLLAKQQQITSLFIINDTMTIGAVQAIKDIGLRCPEDIALVGCGDFEGASIINPPITTVNLSPETMGKIAFDALLSKITNAGYNKQLQLPTSLIIRKSCGC